MALPHSDYSHAIFLGLKIEIVLLKSIQPKVVSVSALIALRLILWQGIVNLMISSTLSSCPIIRIYIGMMIINQSGTMTQEIISESDNVVDIETGFMKKHYNPSSLKEKLAYHLIRPSRTIYHETLLWPSFSQERFYKHQQYLIPFKLSLFKVQEMRYVILYLHGNSSSRLEGYLLFKKLPPEIGLACFDFAGCGNRFEQQFITLGKREAKEVDIAARFLKEKGHYVVGWGRSMGAVSLLLSEELEIMIADSPYSSLSRVCSSIARSSTPRIFHCFLSCFYSSVIESVSSFIHEKTQLDINEMQICEIISKQKVQSKKLFVIGAKSDEIIPVSQFQQIFQNFSGKKDQYFFEGSHNSQRSQVTINRCIKFIDRNLPKSHKYHQIVRQSELNIEKRHSKYYIRKKSQQIKVKGKKPYEENNQSSLQNSTCKIANSSLMLIDGEQNKSREKIRKDEVIQFKSFWTDTFEESDEKNNENALTHLKNSDDSLVGQKNKIIIRKDPKFSMSMEISRHIIKEDREQEKDEDPEFSLVMKPVVLAREVELSEGESNSVEDENY